MQRESVSKERPLGKSGRQPPRGQCEGVKKKVVRIGDGGRREKIGERDGTGGVCARASVATVHGRRAGKLWKRSLRCLALKNALACSLPVLASDRHAFRHLADCRFSARGNMHRDLDLAAGSPVVLAHVQSLGYPLAALHSPCIAGCEFVCATGEVRTDAILGILFFAHSDCQHRLYLRLTETTYS
eukprot:2334332-Pleurochrysis_carterae.AAC.2